MKCLVPIPPESATSLRREKETGLGYQIVSVVLKDSTRFEQVVAGEGCIIAIRGFAEVPVEFNEVATLRQTIGVGILGRGPTHFVR
jgi:hypothetical protein